MPGWSRLTCLFGLPDDASPDDLIAAALGPVLRAAAQPIADEPLPEGFILLLRRLEHAEKEATTHAPAAWPAVEPSRIPSPAEAILRSS